MSKKRNAERNDRRTHFVVPIKVFFKKLTRRNKGFTLLETLIVIAILSILARIVLVAMNDARDDARIAVAQSTLQNLRTAIGQLEDDTGEWPDHKQIDVVEGGAAGNELWDLNEPRVGLIATDGLFSRWNGPYTFTRRIPLDPWGNNYFFDTDYTVNGNDAVVLGSFGPNGVGPNLYDSDDIIEVFVSE